MHTFSFSTYDAIATRKHPTTQIAIEVAEWPGNTFLLWLPESSANLWSQMIKEVAIQKFENTPSGGLTWETQVNPLVTIRSEIIIKDYGLLLEVRIHNRSDQPIPHVTAQNCFHMPRAKDFACEDFSRIYIRTEGRWKSLAEITPQSQLPMYYAGGFRESKKVDSWRGDFKHCDQKERSDHPLMICLSRDGNRAVATASENYQCVFHNSDPRYVCIHSQQTPHGTLAVGDTALFRQKLFFINGGIEECEKAFDASH